MRILRLFAPSLMGDQTLCFADSHDGELSKINDVSMKIKLARAGDDLSGDSFKECFTIVMQREFKISDGEFFAVDGGSLLLRFIGAQEVFEVVSSGFISVSAKAEIWRPIRSAILTVSDKGSCGERVNTAGPALEELLLFEGGVVEEREIVPDDISAIQNAVKNWCEKGLELVLITGGTGLSERDVTPEALLAIADKTVPGFGEMMRMQTLVYTPRAFLTRGVAVIIKRTLVIAFPGSERGARQCFEAVSEGLRHGVETLAGWDSECGGHKHHGH